MSVNRPRDDPGLGRWGRNEAVIDLCWLYWIPCKDMQEVNYLMAIINSDGLSKAVTPLMPKGQFGARDLHKHLWKLPIPEFAPDDPLHYRVSQAGNLAAQRAAKQLIQLTQDRGEVGVNVARREIRHRNGCASRRRARSWRRQSGNCWRRR